MFNKRVLFLIVYFFLFIEVVYADSDQITSVEIATFNLTTGVNNDVVDLDEYFNGTDLSYKFKAGNKGLSGVTISIDKNSRVDITANLPGQYSVIFIADNSTDDKESNDVVLNVVGEAVEGIDFFPVGSEVMMDVGEKKTFAVSGDNISAEWYLDNLKLPQTGGTFIYDAALGGNHVLQVNVGSESNTWNITVSKVEKVENVQPVEIKQPICGNNLRESGENCGNCPEDVKCSGGSSCKNSVCVKDTSVSFAILWIIVLGVVIFGVIVAVILMKKKGYLDNINFDFVEKLFNRKTEEKVEESNVVEEKENLEPLRNYLFGNKNYSKQDLIKEALKQGWTQEQIDEVVSRL